MTLHIKAGRPRPKLCAQENSQISMLLTRKTENINEYSSQENQSSNRHRRTKLTEKSINQSVKILHLSSPQSQKNPTQTDKSNQE